jgi:hypothetical protein
MKWIKGVWDKTNDMLFVNPNYITTVDTGRKLLWAQDCDVAVRYDEGDYPLILKLIGRTEEEALDKQGSDKGAAKK